MGSIISSFLPRLLDVLVAESASEGAGYVPKKKETTFHCCNIDIT